MEGIVSIGHTVGVAILIGYFYIFFIILGHGSTYVRWGRTVCPGNGTEKVYSGNSMVSEIGILVY